jgi:hypothetical protein
MMKTFRRIAAVLVAPVALVACSDDEAAGCEPTDPQFLENLGNEQATDGLSEFMSVDLSEPAAGYEKLVAARIATGDDSTIGIWAIGPDAGPILAIDDAAKENSDWAVAEPGSPADDVAEEMRSSPDYETALSCLE